MTKKETLKSVPKGEAAVIEQFIPKKNGITMTRKELLYDTGSDSFSEDVLTFNDIKGYSLNGPFLIVQQDDDTQYIFQYEDFKFIKTFVIKE